MARPNLQPNESSHPGTAWDKSFVGINFNDIEEWADFTEENANKAFYKVLDHSISQGNHLNAPFTAIDRQTTIEHEEDIDRYFLQAIGPIISHSIECTRDLLSNASGNEMALNLRVPFSTEAAKIRLPGDDNHSSQHLKRPNFPIYLPAKSMPGMKPTTDVIFVVGESARSVVWDPYCFKDPAKFAKNGFVHLGKVAMYCKAADTCLAFTMTTEGATVFRFFTLDNGNGKERWGVQVATFPWCPEWHPLPAENDMSAAKAIWCCIMMSLDPEGRKIQRKDNLRPLSSWPRF
ncbi:hypothetical protein PG999_005331 [Apiospora kogelbergensis]|uniref:Fungal-type protein kinase domain-containing protein n=1 Tax=Apiospora kogelbergensis TaxID=1337665 RepID=A0AAW0R1S7_9PEZI